LYVLRNRNLTTNNSYRTGLRFLFIPNLITHQQVFYTKYF